MRVLHVVESYGGGVASALDRYVRSTPHHEHHLIARVREGDFSHDGELDSFVSARRLGASFLRAHWNYRRALSELHPDVVHAHSSLAGALVRLSSPAGRAFRIVYTPHCFAHERLDIPRSFRHLFRATEALLARRTDAFAACSPREATLAVRLSRNADVIIVPNVVDLADIGNTRRSRVSHTVVGAGRLTAQKDPRFFVNVVDGLRDIGEPIELRWLGGSIGRDADHLEEAGIAVTGWLPRQEAIRELASAAVYVHTAAWEGAPMALLEANALRVPIIARDIPALEGLPASVMAPTPSGMRSLIWKILTDPDAVKANLAVWDQYFSSNSVSTQVEALRLAYGESGAGNLEDQGL